MTPEWMDIAWKAGLLVGIGARVHFGLQSVERDLKQVKQALGFQNGDKEPRFVTTDRCALMENTVSNKLVNIETRLDEVIGRINREET